MCSQFGLTALKSNSIFLACMCSKCSVNYSWCLVLVVDLASSESCSPLSSAVWWLWLCLWSRYVYIQVEIIAPFWQTLRQLKANIEEGKKVDLQCRDWHSYNRRFCDSLTKRLWGFLLYGTETENRFEFLRLTILMGKSFWNAALTYSFATSSRDDGCT